MSDETIVETTHGPVRGTKHVPVQTWKGIRYAAAPIGELRWRAPQPPRRWTAVPDATSYSGTCPQPTLARSDYFWRGNTWASGCQGREGGVDVHVDAIIGHEAVPQTKDADAGQAHP